MKKKTLIVICYVILPWLYGGLNQLLSGRVRVLAADISHIIFLQTIFPIFYGLNLALFLCMLSFLYIKIIKHIKHHCLVSILGVSVYPLSYYFILLLNYIGVGISTLTNIVMKATPFLYFDRFSLPVLLAVSFMAIIINWCVKKGFIASFSNDARHE